MGIHCHCFFLSPYLKNSPKTEKRNRPLFLKTEKRNRPLFLKTEKRNRPLFSKTEKRNRPLFSFFEKVYQEVERLPRTSKRLNASKKLFISNTMQEPRRGSQLGDIHRLIAVPRRGTSLATITQKDWYFSSTGWRFCCRGCCGSW